MGRSKRASERERAKARSSMSSVGCAEVLEVITSDVTVLNDQYSGNVNNYLSTS
jgi:hypothetical protein